MVAGTATAARKRRKADDMAESPPKRVTRARAAKSTEEPTADGPVTKKITTASARLAGTSKATAASKVTKATTTRKKADEPENAAEKADDKNKVTKTTKASTRGRATTKKYESAETEADVDDAPQTRTRRMATAAKPTAAAAKVTKPSTRAKKTASKTEEASAAEEAPQEEPKRSTRGRPAAAATRATASSTTRSTASTTTQTTAPRKKVTFEDEATDDKENIPVTKAGAKKATAKATIGIKARPVRRAAAPTRSALRSKKTEDTTADAGPASPAKPLSPKKIHQVAKSWSGSSEDELLERIPVRALSKSPVKNPLSPHKALPQSTEPMAAASEPQSPSKEAPSSPMKSPAKRPPASPFKDTLRESPKKFLFSPKKDDGARDVAQSLFKDSIRQSPKKASFLASFSPAKQLQPAQTPLKASLLASPARRPSPEKVAMMISPGKSTLALPAIEQSLHSGNPNPAQPPTLGLPVRSPVKAANELHDESSNEAMTVPEDNPAANDEFSVPAAKEGRNCMLVEAADGALTPPGMPEPTKAHAPRVSDAPRFRVAPSLADSESEDELVSFDAAKRTPARRTRRSSRFRRSAATPGIAAAPSGDLGITPLAVQLSSWLASSPEKRLGEGEEQSSSEEQPHGIFANIAVSVSKRQSSSSNESVGTVVMNSSPRFFADQMALRDLEAVQVHEDQGGEDTADADMVDADDAALEVASQATEHYGDENASPVGMSPAVESPTVARDGTVTRMALAETILMDGLLDGPDVVEETAPLTTNSAPIASPVVEINASVTPMRKSPLKRREVHTVSKVPLRPDGGRSPIKILKKRSKSMAHSLEASGDLVRIALAENTSVEAEQAEVVDEIMDDIDSVAEAATPRPILSEKPPATMPAKARKMHFSSEENESPIRFPKKRSKSMGHALSGNEQDQRTYLAPSTSFETQGAEVSSDEDELAEVTTPRVVLSEVPPATMPVKTRKVPLRPEGDGSPLKIPKKRGKSTGIPSNQVLDFSREQWSNFGALPNFPEGNHVVDASTPRTTATGSPRAISSPDPRYSPITPSKAVRTGADAQVLRGALVFVDVHTTEGADASGIFVELLTQMGARCVKQWTWNPRPSVSGAGVGAVESPEDLAKSGKVGITHVVFKDGGKRTLQKVREAKGLVLCVGVGWVLDCEKSNQWLDEAAYAVDTSTIPRGGHNRRKSMEPRALANLNGSLVVTPGGGATPKRAASYEFSPTKSLLEGTPAATHRSPASDNEVSMVGTPQVLPATPGTVGAPSAWGSPTTPYFLSQGAQLIQQTCPPKQSMQGLFPVSGNIEDEPDAEVRRRLIAARRKSLQWAPKVGSPLGQAVSYGK